MLANAVWVLRQRRYAALAVFMVALAAFCAFAGTWQVSRYGEKVRENDALRADAHAAAVALTPAVLPLTGTAPAPAADRVRFRTVTASGSYLAGAPQYLRNQTVGGTDGFLVVSRLRTADGILLVGRGFVAPQADGSPPETVPAVPAGPVRLTGRLQTADPAADHAGVLPGNMIDTVNPAAQAARLGLPVFDGYLDLDPQQPGSSGLQALPPPDLSNPAGGAAEWQHLAYIVQWYIFAGLALAAPFAVCAHEVRQARKQFLGHDPADIPFDAVGPGDGLLALPAGPSAGGELAVRPGAAPALRGPTPAQWARAARLADRYGRSLGRGTPAPGGEPPAARAPDARRGIGTGIGTGIGSGIGHDYRPASSAQTPARAGDEYHGAYNDYLWQLALADGDVPDVTMPDPPPGTSPGAGAPEPFLLPTPRVIDPREDRR